MSLSDDLVRAFSWVDGHADVRRWFGNPPLFARIITALARPFERDGITRVAGIEARAFVLAGAVARELDAGFLPVRKEGGHLPGPKMSLTTSRDYRDRAVDLVLQRGVITSSDRVLVVDDWMETGSQLRAAVALIRRSGAHVVGASVIVDEASATLHPDVPRFHALVDGEHLGPSRSADARPDGMEDRDGAMVRRTKAGRRPETPSSSRCVHPQASGS